MRALGVLGLLVILAVPALLSAQVRLLSPAAR